MLTTSTEISDPSSKSCVSDSKFDSMFCFNPNDILSLSASMDSTIVSMRLPFLYDLIKSSGLPRLVTSDI